MKIFFDLIDLSLTLILLGAIFTEIIGVRSILDKSQDAVQNFSKHIISKELSENLKWLSKVCGYIGVISLILSIFIFYTNLSNQFNLFRNLMLLSFCCFYLYMSSHIVLDTRKNLVKFAKSNWIIFVMPLIVCALDYFMGGYILQVFNNHNFSLFNNHFYLYVCVIIFIYIVFILSFSVQALLAALFFIPLRLLMGVVIYLCEKYDRLDEKRRFNWLVIILFIINKLILIFSF